MECKNNSIDNVNIKYLEENLFLSGEWASECHVWRQDDDESELLDYLKLDPDNHEKIAALIPQ